MNGTVEQAQMGHQGFQAIAETHAARKAWDYSVAEAIGGLAAVVLSIIGLAGVLPTDMLSITTILVGLNLVFQGGALCSRCSALWESSVGRRSRGGIFNDFMSASFFGGVAGIVLGVLSLIRMDTLMLAAVAAIVYGGSLLLDSGFSLRINAFELAAQPATGRSDVVTHEVASNAAGAQILVAVGAIILGILAVVGYAPMTLSLVAFLSLGASVLMTSCANQGWW